MKTKIIAIAVSTLFLVSVAFMVLTNSTAIAPAGSVDQDFYGWKMSSRTPAYPNWPGDWVKGDLGKNWKELDWVSYVLVLNGYGGTTLPAFDIQFDFYISTKDAVFVDLVRYFSYRIRPPYGGSGKPDDVTPANFAIWRDGALTPTVINRPFPYPGTSDSQTNPPGFSFWRLTPNPVFAAPIPSGKSVVIYFEARLAPSFIWLMGKEYLLNQAPTNAWGGDRYGPPYSADWTATHGGSGYTSGSNPQFRLSGVGVGQKTVPIPIPPLATGEIHGTKFFDKNQDGVWDQATEPGLGGWTINLDAIIEGIPFPLTTTTAGDGSYVFTNLPAATYTISEVLQSGWTQTGPKPVPPGTHTVVLGEGEIVTGKDFGNVKLSRTVTELSASTITLGQSVTDTATVSSVDSSPPTPTGTVTFYVGTSTSGPWTQVGAVKPLVSGSATSDSYTPLATGTYYFKANYSGDSTYLPSESDPATEVLVVNKATPTVTTLLSSSSITLGQSITDTATVTGLGGSFPAPTGTVTFYVGTSVSGPWTQVGAVKPLVGGSATSDSYTPLAAGTYYFKAVYSGDSNYLSAESDPATEVLVVNKATPTVTTLLSSSTITLGQSITDTATVTGLGGSFPVPTGTVTFYVGTSTSGPWTQVGAVKALVAGSATSDSYTPLATGTYYFKAVYSGDSNYLSAESDPATEVLVVNKATPTVTTLLSSSTITLGQSITDTATVTGLGGSFPVPTGTVTFYVGPSTSGPWTQVGAVKALVAGSATSDSYMPLATGTYYFKAVYSGDSNYLSAESDPATEVLVVNKATPTVTTLLSSTTITLGQSITDTATVTGLGGSFPVPTGTVTFYVGTSVSGPWTQVGAVKALVAGSATSDSYTPLAAGTYYFKAVYSGDSNYLTAQSDPATEVLVVNKATPTVTTLLSSSSITLGQSITDTATVTGLGGLFPAPTGTVTFYVGTSTSGPWTQVGAIKPLVAGSATSDSYTPLATGNYYFKAVYSGDSNYLSAESDPATELLVVNKATPTVTTLLSAAAINLGQSVTDTATVTGLGGLFPVPTGTVTFYVGPSTGGPWTQVGAVKALVGGVATSDSYTPPAAGTYYFKAVYSGDSNYLGAESDPATEVLVVDKAPTTTVTLLSASTIALGDSVTDTITISTSATGTLPDATGTWIVEASQDPTFTTGVITVDSGSVSGQLPFGVTTNSWTPPSIGTWYFRATYSGDSNYLGSQSDPLAEQLVVTGITHTVGYWKNHPEDWDTEYLAFGISPTTAFPWTTGKLAGKSYMDVLWADTSSGDASIILAQQYIAARLNELAYGVPSSIHDKIIEAEGWLALYPAGSKPPKSSPDRAAIIALAAQLEAYNRSGEPSP